MKALFLKLFSLPLYTSLSYGHQEDEISEHSDCRGDKLFMERNRHLLGSATRREAWFHRLLRKLPLIYFIIIYSKYFSVSDWCHAIQNRSK